VGGPKAAEFRYFLQAIDIAGEKTTAPPPDAGRLTQLAANVAGFGA
jgi:hypothetical protein